MTIEYHPEVEPKLKVARDYYEKRSPGLGEQFIDEFERQALRIAANPGRWMVIKSDIRRALREKRSVLHVSTLVHSLLDGQIWRLGLAVWFLFQQVG